MKEFKVGDKVYFPMQTTEVCTLTETKSIPYPFSVCLKGCLANCTASGEFYENSGISNIFHATQENKELLDKLHGIEFQTPPLTDLELLEELLVNNNKGVLCWVWDTAERGNRRIISVVSLVCENGSVQAIDGVSWRHAKPLTEEEIQGYLAVRTKCRQL